MDVLMAKSERIQVAYSDYKHLSTDNLTFVAGLRGRPVPAPSSEPGQKKARRPLGGGIDKKTEVEEVEDADDSSLEEVPVGRLACPSRSCGPRTEVLEVLAEKRIAAQIARQKAQSKLGWVREKAHESEGRLEEAKAEMIRMSKSIAEGEERTEDLRETCRNVGSVNKECVEELATVLAEAMSLRRTFEADTLPPHPAAANSSAGGSSVSFACDLQPPVPAPGQSQATNRGSREWIHSGQLGHTRIFMHPPKPAGSLTPAKRRTVAIVGGDAGRPPNVGDFGAAGVAGITASEQEDNSSEAEETWSCCGKMPVSGGRGCEPKEPLATPDDLLLDTVDPRSRLGRPLDFREFLPRIAWMGLTPEPLNLFAESPSEGTLRPHTAPERLDPGREEYGRNMLRARRSGGGFANQRAGLHPDSGVNAWWRNKKLTGRHTGEEGGAVPKPHEFLRRSGHTGVRSSSSRHKLASARKGVGGRFAAGGGGGQGNPNDQEFWPVTQILGMNGGRLPKEVRQAPIGRPLTAPCGKVGRRRINTHGSR